jgi:TPR repeat protein
MRATTLLVGCILLSLVGISAGRTTKTQSVPRPLSLTDVEHGLKSGVPSARMAVLVKRYGVDFQLSDGIEKKLRSVGANHNLILQIGRSTATRSTTKSGGHSIESPSKPPVGARKHRSSNDAVLLSTSTGNELLKQADKYRLGLGMERDEAKAVRLYRKAAEIGNTEAQTRFAEALFDGRGVKRDSAESRVWLEKAAREGNARAECDLGVIFKNGLDTPQDLANGLRHLQAAARLGDAYAEDYLGQYAENGLVGDPSPSEAYMHYVKSSEMGSAWGAYNIARMHERGIGVDQSSAEALRWYMKVASIENPELKNQWSDLRSEAEAIARANFRIGDMYARGTGVPIDTREADKWYRRAVDMESDAALAGWSIAHVSLANAYLQSRGVPLDYGEAMYWMRKAAEHGYRQAQVNLGSMYRDGQGIRQDYGEAMHWYRKAADQGSAVAEWMIGGLYFRGLGVIRDYTEAATWFRRAATADVPVAQWDLGMMYYHGYGVSRDILTARVWLRKAASRGYAPAKELLADVSAEGKFVTAGAHESLSEVSGR